MGPPQYEIVWGCMGVEENQLGGKTELKTVDSNVALLIWAGRHADMNPKPNLES